MYCRLCLYECCEENAVDIFSNGEESDLAKEITKFLHLEVAPSDNLSTRICESCMRHLADFIKFYQYVEQRQSGLQNEFLEIKCIANRNTEILKSIEQLEESMLDLKDIVPDYNNLTPQDEFSFAENNIEDLHNDLEDFHQTNYPKTTDLPIFQNISEEKGEVSPKKQGRKTRNKKTSSNFCKKAASTEEMNETNSCPEKRTLNDAVKPKRTKRVYTKENNLNDQIIAEHMRLKCEICDATAETFRKLRTHFRIEHKAIAYVTCCSTIFRRRATLVDHINVHLNPEYFKCNFCNKLLKSRKGLDRHKISNHTDKNDLKYACTICGRRFAHLSNQKAHMLSHSNERKFICEHCNKAFKSLTILKVHIRSMHQQRAPHICDTCGKEYKFKPSFERHMAEHQGKIEEPTEQCQICAKWFTPLGLRRHMERHKFEEAVCSICGKMLKSKGALKGHMEYAHNAAKFSCTYCGKTFKRSSVLKEHIAMHTGQKDNTCPHCPREFRSRANMYAHIKKMHVQEWVQAQLDRNRGPIHFIQN